MRGIHFKKKFLIFWLICLEVAICVMRPTSSDARLIWGVSGCCHISRCILPFQKPFE